MAVFKRGLPTLRNIVYSKLGIWPVSSLSDHWIVDIPTLCISLRNASARRKSVETQVRTIGFRNFEFIDAVESSKLSLESVQASGEYDDVRSRQFHTKGLSLNEIACSLSHAIAYQRIVDRQYAWALILEDDVLFRTRRLRRLRFEEIPTDVDIVFLNAFLDTTPPTNQITQSLFSDHSYLGSSAAYLVRLATAQKLLRESRPVTHAADGLLGRSLSWSNTSPHAFRQQGVAITLTAAVVYPEAATNGSVEHYYHSAVQPASP